MGSTQTLGEGEEVLYSELQWRSEYQITLNFGCQMVCFFIFFIRLSGISSCVRTIDTVVLLWWTTLYIDKTSCYKCSVSLRYKLYPNHLKTDHLKYGHSFQNADQSHNSTFWILDTKMFSFQMLPVFECPVFRSPLMMFYLAKSFSNSWN